MSERIQRIVIQDFRAFPGSHTYSFELKGDGKNLLIYGENGSGKSSLYHALRLLLKEAPPVEPFAAHCNVFDPGHDGTITVALTNAPPRDFRWEHGGDHPATNRADATFFEAARRTAFLDYKTMLRTSLLHEDSDCVDLFDLLVNSLLRDYKLPDGKTLSQHWNDVLYFQPPTPPPEDEGDEPEERDSPEKQINDIAQAYRELLLGVINAGRIGIQPRANRILRQLDPRLRIVLRLDAIRLVRRSFRPDEPHDFKGLRIRLEATYCKRKVPHPPLFLNEARLTAIAFSLYLAGVQMAIPDSVGAIAPKLLVMDDVLIGLDITHRIPVLKLMQKELHDWQIILMTHDRIWYDLAKEYTKHEKKWAYYTMRELAAPSNQPTIPWVSEEGAEEVILMLDRADYHVSKAPPDLMAAAVYIRAAFETRVKAVCKKRCIRVEFQPNPKDVSANSLWESIVRHDTDRRAEGKGAFLPQTLINDVNTVRSRVLNAFSHSGTPHLVPTDVQLALTTIRALNQHNFPK